MSEYNQSAVLLDGVLVTGAGTNIRRRNRRATYQARVVGTGAQTAVVNIEGTNDGLGYDVIGTITLSGTTSASDSFSSEDRYSSVRANCTSISGTGAALTVTMAD